MMKRLTQSARIVRVLLALALLAGFYLRVRLLAAQDLWGDEAMSAFMANIPLRDAMAPLVDVHPPLYYMLLNLWARLAGTSVFALRFASVVFSVPMVALAYCLGGCLLDRRTGAIAAWLVALSPLEVYYAQELRMYSLVATLGAASWLFLARQLQARVLRCGLWAGHLLTSLAALYSHFEAIPLLMGQGVVAFLFWRRDAKRLLAWLAGMLVLVTAFLPWVMAQARFLGRLSSNHSYVLSLPRLVTVASKGLETYVGGMTASPEHTLVGSLLALALAAIGYMSIRSRALPLTLLFVWLTSSLVLWWLIDPLMPYFHARYVMAGASALLLSSAVGLSWVAERSGRVALALLLLSTGISTASLHAWYTDPAYRKSDYGQAIAKIASQAQAGDCIILNDIQQQFLFDYYRPQGLPSASLARDDTLSPKRAAAALERQTEGHDRVWLITYGTALHEPQHGVEKWLAEHGYWARSTSHIGFTVNLYILGTRPSSPPVPLEARFADGVRLMGYDLRPQPVQAGDSLFVALYWKAETTPQMDYTVFVHLRNSQGSTVAQFDGQPAGGTQPTTDWQPNVLVVDTRSIAVPHDLAPGDYDVWVGLYTWPDIQNLKLLDPPGGSTLLLTKVTVY